MKNVVVWYVAPCGSCKNIRFGGTFRLLHEDRKIRKRRKALERWHISKDGILLMTNLFVEYLAIL
jgi:hypothetical protein